MVKYFIFHSTFVVVASLVLTEEVLSKNVKPELNIKDFRGDRSLALLFVTPTNTKELNTSEEEAASDNTTKHKLFYECVLWTLEPGEYIIINGTAIVKEYNISYNSSFYKLEGENLKICMPEWNAHEVGMEDGVSKYPLSFTYITAIGLGVSIICLVLHLLAFALVKEIRNLPGYNLAALCFSLLMGYISFLSGHANAIQSSYVPCVITAACSHFFLLASFMWMNAMAFDVLKAILNATGKLRLPSTRFSIKKFSINCLYTWGISLLFVIIALTFDKVDGIPPEYRPLFGEETCWFHQRKPLLIFFAAPVFLVIVLNVIFFGLSSYTIFTNRMKTEDVQKRMLKRNFVVHSRLAVIMGLTWIVGVLAGIVDHIILWYIFVIFNTLQGLFIFLAFTCTKKVKNTIRDRMGLSPRQFSCQMTFQTYCNLETSFDTGLSVPMGTVKNIQMQHQMTV